MRDTFKVSFALCTGFTFDGRFIPMRATYARILKDLFDAFPNAIPGEKLYPSNSNARRTVISLTRKAIAPLGWNIERNSMGWVLEMPYFGLPRQQA